MKKICSFLLLSILFAAGCGINSVTKEELANVKPGNVLFYRYYRPEDAKSWFYANKITRIEGDKIYYNSGLTEATSVRESRLLDFDKKKEEYIFKDELIQYADEQGEDKKVIIRIQ